MRLLCLAHLLCFIHLCLVSADGSTFAIFFFKDSTLNFYWTVVDFFSFLVFYYAVKVLVFLTMPIESSSNDIPQQIEYLWGLKSAITCSDTVAVIVSLLEGPLENLER